VLYLADLYDELVDLNFWAVLEYSEAEKEKLVDRGL
jgi:hypothetical protein